MAPGSDAHPLAALKGRDYLSSADLDVAETGALLDLAADLKAGRRRCDLSGRSLGLIFTKASTRTRVSFTMAMARLGGHTIDLDPAVTQLGRGEPLADTARVLSRYVDALAVRTYAQSELEDYAHWASIPVVNALTDREHPCQALADYLTLREAFGAVEGLTLAYVGDGNNVAHSLLLCGALLGVNVRVGTPPGFAPDPAVTKAFHEGSVRAGPAPRRRPLHDRSGARAAGGGARRPCPLHRRLGVDGAGGGATEAGAGLPRLVPR